MDKKIVYVGQSFLDKVIETTGDVENAFEMAFLNKMAVTDRIQIGSTLIISDITNKVVERFFNETNKPASEVTYNSESEVVAFPYEFVIEF